MRTQKRSEKKVVKTRAPQNTIPRRADIEESSPAPASPAVPQGPKPEQLMPAQRENSRPPAPSVTSAVDPFAILKPGEMVVECPPLSVEGTDTTGPASRLLQKLGFGAEWPPPSFPIRTDVREELGRARRVVEARGVLVEGDPLNPLGDGRSWVMPCKLPDELSKRQEAPDLVRQWIESEGVKVAARPVWESERLLVCLWDSGRVSAQTTPLLQATPAASAAIFQSSPDYRSIRWRGQHYTLTRNQAAIVKRLHEALLAGTPVLGKAELLRTIEAETSRLRDSFKDSPLWGTLIAPDERRRGAYKLNI